MAVSIVETSSGIDAGADPYATSHTHAAGKDLCAIVLWRSNSATISSVTYDGAAMTLIVASGQGGADPGVSASAYRIDDPGNKTADISVDFAVAVPSHVLIYSIEVTGTNATSPIDSSSGTPSATGTDLTTTHTRIASDTYSILAAVRGRGSTVISFTGNDGMNEEQDEDGGANPSIATCLYTLQEVASGSLTRHATASSGGKGATVMHFVRDCCCRR